MAKILKSSGDVVALPSELLNRLNLKEGDEVTAIVDGHKLGLVRIEEFASLRGALAGDDGFDEALELLDQACQSWKSPASA
ncbi:MAG TPA: AbrB/MazE/SpoVT family DNA-binding domain-containing protein [Blastocatellia bacterium]